MATGSLQQFGKSVIRILQFKNLAPKRKQEKEEGANPVEGATCDDQNTEGAAVSSDLHPDGAENADLLIDGAKSSDLPTDETEKSDQLGGAKSSDPQTDGSMSSDLPPGGVISSDSADGATSKEVGADVTSSTSINPVVDNDDQLNVSLKAALTEEQIEESGYVIVEQAADKTESDNPNISQLLVNQQEINLAESESNPMIIEDHGNLSESKVEGSVDRTNADVSLSEDGGEMPSVTLSLAEGLLQRNLSEFEDFLTNQEHKPAFHEGLPQTCQDGDTKDIKDAEVKSDENEDIKTSTMEVHEQDNKLVEERETPSNTMDVQVKDTQAPDECNTMEVQKKDSIISETETPSNTMDVQEKDQQLADQQGTMDVQQMDAKLTDIDESPSNTMDIKRKDRRGSTEQLLARRKGVVVPSGDYGAIGSGVSSQNVDVTNRTSATGGIAESARMFMAGIGIGGLQMDEGSSSLSNSPRTSFEENFNTGTPPRQQMLGLDSPGIMETSIDSQASFQSNASAGSGLDDQVAGDVCVVCEDFKGTGNEGEISVCVGQQVEVLDTSPPGGSEWCLVRPLVSVEGIVGQHCPEGVVPMSILKHLPNLRVSVSRTSINNDAPEPTVSEAGSGMSTLGMTSGSTSAQSPANKRRSSFRKWLMNPVRKLSSHKLTEKGAIEKESSTKDGKTPSKSDKKFGLKEQIETSNDSVASSAPVTQQPESSTTQQGALEDEGAEEEVAVEMPPPMQEISTIPLPSNDVAADEKLNPEATDGSGSEQGDRSSLPGTQGEGQEGDDLSDNVTAEGGLSEDENNRQKNLRKRNFVIRELIETERDYVHDLGLIVEGYMHLINTGEVTLPEGMEGKDKIVFGNIHQIYDWHKDIFKKELEKCMDEPERIGYLFIRYEKQMQMYVKYCENKPKSDYIVPEYYDWFEELRQQLGHRLSIPDLLIKPVQRIMKYQLLLKDILKYTDKAGEDTKDLQRGVGVMVVVPKKADDMMNVCRLQGFHGKIHAQGELLLQDTLMVTEVGSKVKSDRSKIKERRVFLFEQIVIVSEEVEKKKNSLSSSSYIFKNSIMSNKMGLHESGNPGDLTFTLNDKAPGSDLKLVMQAPSEQVRQNWVSQIRSILDMQGDFLKALQSPIAYQKELTLTKELKKKKKNES